MASSANSSADNGDCSAGFNTTELHHLYLDSARQHIVNDAMVDNVPCSLALALGPDSSMYYIEHGDFLIVMLGGGSKATQRADIAKAIAMAKTIED